jgi:FixJ family two-component response regulator
MTQTDAWVFVVDDEPMRQSLKNLIGSVGLRVEVHTWRFPSFSLPAMATSR